MIRSSLLAAVTVFSMVGSAPAAGQAGNVRVFFDWGKQDIRSDDQALLDRVATDFSARPGARLVLTGHSDRSGSATQNLRSSARRAATVRDYLVAHGVPGSAITLVSRGEAEPLVPTEDGVREVQNRRVEIRFQ